MQCYNLLMHAQERFHDGSLTMTHSHLHCRRASCSGLSALAVQFSPRFVQGPCNIRQMQFTLSILHPTSPPPPPSNCVYIYIKAQRLLFSRHECKQSDLLVYLWIEASYCGEVKACLSRYCSVYLCRERFRIPRRFVLLVLITGSRIRPVEPTFQQNCSCTSSSQPECGSYGFTKERKCL
jgi:hypothetical protein